MFEIFEEVFGNEYGSIKMYGIYLKNLQNEVIKTFNSLTSDKESLQKFIGFCSATAVTELTIDDIIYDYISQL